MKIHILILILSLLFLISCKDESVRFMEFEGVDLNKEIPVYISEDKVKETYFEDRVNAIHAEESYESAMKAHEFNHTVWRIQQAAEEQKKY